MPVSKGFDWAKLAGNMLLPAVVFIGSAGTLYAKLDQLVDAQEKTERQVETIIHKVDKMEVKVEFLYDDLKKR